MNAKASSPTQAERIVKTVQSLDCLQLPDALLRMQTVVQVTGLSPSSIYRKVAAGQLPIVRISLRCTRFRAADVRAFIAAQGAML